MNDYDVNRSVDRITYLGNEYKEGKRFRFIEGWGEKEGAYLSSPHSAMSYLYQSFRLMVILAFFQRDILLIR